MVETTIWKAKPNMQDSSNGFFGRIRFVKSEVLATLVPFMTSDAYREHKIRDVVIKDGLKEKLDQDELFQTMEKARNAINTILRKNSFNVKSDVLDIMPIAIFHNPRLFILWIMAFSISLYGSISEYRYRKKTLNPIMKRVREDYQWYTHEKDPVNHSHPIRDNLDIWLEWAETLVELISFLIPNLMIPWVFAPLFEIPLDVHSRKNYYDLMKELEIMLIHLKEIEEKEKKLT